MTTPKPSDTASDKGQATGIIIDMQGRVKSWKKIQPENGSDFIQTTVVRPAKDAYSHPATFAVNSISRIGQEGSDISVKCELRPYMRKRNGEDYHNISLWAIE